MKAFSKFEIIIFRLPYEIGKQECLNANILVGERTYTVRALRLTLIAFNCNEVGISSVKVLLSCTRTKFPTIYYIPFIINKQQDKPGK